LISRVYRCTKGCSFLTRVQRSLVDSTLACCKADQGCILLPASQLKEVLLAEQTNDKRNQEISECREKCQSGAGIFGFLRLVNCVSPASAFRHLGQSGTAGNGKNILISLCNTELSPVITVVFDQVCHLRRCELIRFYIFYWYILIGQCE
jgi:hypothetical protein